MIIAKTGEYVGRRSFGIVNAQGVAVILAVLFILPLMTGGAAAQSSDAGQMTRKQLIAYAKHLVRECTTCHSLYGQDAGIPVMVGLSVSRFKDTIDLYRSGKRDNQVMVNVSRSLDKQQIHALAVYLSGIAKPAASSRAVGTAVAKPGAAPAIQANEQWQPTWRHMTARKMKRANGWVSRGEAQLKIGRVNEARLWLERAAEYGIVKAALLLGSSFDPAYLRSGARIGMKPDPEKARDWYIYARQLGSPEAVRRLAALPRG